MLNVSIEPLVHQYLREYPKHHLRSKLWSPCPFNCSPKKLVFHGRSFFCDFKHPRPLVVNANSNAAAIVETFQSTNLLFKETFPLEQKLVVWISFLIPPPPSYGKAKNCSFWFVRYVWSMKKKRTSSLSSAHIFVFVSRACFNIWKLELLSFFHFVVHLFSLDIRVGKCEW